MSSESGTVLAPGLVVAETYEVERQLGRGGMGEVWLAKHRRLAGKLVAIKVLRTGGQLPVEALARFKREAEIAARLEHPNIVQVLDFNTLPTGEPYLVMELLKGGNLAQRLAGGQLPLEQVLNVMRQVGSALQAAHRAGVVHRDLKPENIFLVPTALGDQVKVLDFGISKLSDSQTIQTTESVLIGTPLYMSPEQALGHNKDVTAQSDLFSLGSICYELLTGKPPFYADNVAKVVFRIAYEKHVPLAEVRGDLPPSVVSAIEHALEKDAQKRTKDIDAFVAELTGQALITHAGVADSVSGVYTPGMSVSDSLISGKTVSPSSGGARQLATPSASAAPEPRGVSGKKLAIGLVVVCVLGAAGVVAMRAAWKNMNPVGLPDAGAALTVVPPSPAVVDAGAVAVAAVDAGAEAAPVHDAGAPAEVVKRPRVEDGPMSAEEAKGIAELEAIRASAASDRWERIFTRRAWIDTTMKSDAAKVKGMVVLIDAVCHRHDNTQLKPLVDKLVKLASPSTVKSVRKKCVEEYVDAEAIDWR